jgi:hypothetical protein
MLAYDRIQYNSELQKLINQFGAATVESASVSYLLLNLSRCFQLLQHRHHLTLVMLDIIPLLSRDRLSVEKEGIYVGFIT